MSAIASKAIKSTLATRSISDEFSFVVATTPREREILTSACILCDWLMGWRRKDNSNSSHCIWFLNVDWKSFFLFQQIIVFNNADDVSTLSHLYHLITCYSTRIDLFMMRVWMSTVEKIRFYSYFRSAYRNFIIQNELRGSVTFFTVFKIVVSDCVQVKATGPPSNARM